MTDDREVRDYLAALDAALRDVPREGRAEVLRDVRGHVEEARADEPDVPVRAVLDRLGTPAAIAAEARARYGTVPPGRSSGWDIVAVVLLLFGFFLVPVIGWVVGVVLLWSGPRWTLSDRLLGTFIWPFGYPGLLLGGVLFARADSASTCTEVTQTLDGQPVDDRVFECDTVGSTGVDPVQVTILVLAALAPLVVAVHLLRRARRGA